MLSIILPELMDLYQFGFLFNFSFQLKYFGIMSACSDNKRQFHVPVSRDVNLHILCCDVRYGISEDVLHNTWLGDVALQMWV